MARRPKYVGRLKFTKMIIKDIELKTLRENCVDLMSQTYLELGQRPNKEDVVSFALILSADLKLDFPNLSFEDIKQSFRQGIRNGKEFHLNVQNYYKWINEHRQIIWDNESKEPQQRDKRLQYRSRYGVGTKTIGNEIKKII